MSARLRDLDRLAVFDTETTGTDTDTARIVTAYIGVVTRDGTLVEGASWLLNPGVEIPAEAQAVHGISTAHAAENGSDPAAGVAEIASILDELAAEGVPIVAYNAKFDLTLLNSELARHRLPALDRQVQLVIDPLVIDRHVDKYRRGKRTLESVAALYGVPLDGAHDARADAVATGGVAWKVLDRLPGGMEVTALHQSQVLWARAQALSLQEFFRRTDPTATVNAEWPLKTA